MSETVMRIRVRSREHAMEMATDMAERYREEHPEERLSLAAARAKIWEMLPQLAERYRTMPSEGADASTVSATAIEGGGPGPAMREATRDAQEFMRLHPDRYRSLVSARLEVYKMRPDLAELVRNEQV